MENQIKTERAIRRARKLQDALIEIGKESEKLKDTPDVPSFQLAFDNLKFAIENKDMDSIGWYCRQMAAKVTRFMIDKL